MTPCRLSLDISRHGIHSWNMNSASNNTPTVIAEPAFRAQTNGRAVTIASTHRTEKAAVSRARKIGASIVVACPEDVMSDACWYVVDPSEAVIVATRQVDSAGIAAANAQRRARSAKRHIAMCRKVNCPECRA